MYQAMLIILLAVVAADDQFPTTYDNINIDTILRNQRLLNVYFRCIMDRGRCSPEASLLKKYLPEAVRTNCAKCTEKQRELMHKMLKHMLDKKKGWYEELNAKYDPEGKYREQFRQLAEE